MTITLPAIDLPSPSAAERLSALGLVGAALLSLVVLIGVGVLALLYSPACS